MDSTRLAPASYLQHLAADGARLSDVARGNLDREVPSCPGWLVSDVVEHTGSVFNHKTAGMRLGSRPDEENGWEKAPPAGVDLLDWYDGTLRVLLAELEQRGPDEPNYAWYPPEQSTSFWYRRMAQEAAVHRVDAESAIGAVTPVDDDLALDGIDEVLEVFLCYGLGDDPDEDVTPFDGHSLLVRSGGRAWHVAGRAGDPAGQLLLARNAAPADLVVTGEPSELLLWLWGRRPDSAVTISGERQDVLPAARELLTRATQ